MLSLMVRSTSSPMVRSSLYRVLSSQSNHYSLSSLSSQTDQTSLSSQTDQSSQFSQTDQTSQSSQFSQTEKNENSTKNITDLIKMGFKLGPIAFESSITYDNDHNYNKVIFPNNESKYTASENTTDKSSDSKMNTRKMYDHILAVLKKTDKQLYDIAVYCIENKMMYNRIFATTAVLGLFPAFHILSKYDIFGCGFDNPFSIVFTYGVTIVATYVATIGIVDLTHTSRYSLLMLVIFLGAIAYGTTREYKKLYWD